MLQAFEKLSKSFHWLISPKASLRGKTIPQFWFYLMFTILAFMFAVVVPFQLGGGSGLIFTASRRAWASYFGLGLFQA
jgi:hypothetical protein